MHLFPPQKYFINSLLVYDKHGEQNDFVVQISDVSLERTCVAKYGVKGNTMKNEKSFTIGFLARELDVCVETTRYYHRIGLIPVPKPKAGGGSGFIPGKIFRYYSL